MRIISIFFSFALFFSHSLLAQQDTIFEKLNVLEGIEKATYLNSLANTYLHISPKKALGYATEALEIGKEENDIPIQITSNNQIASVSFQEGDYDEALGIYMETLALSKQNNQEKNTSNLYNNIGNVFYMKGDIDQAISYYQQSLEMEEKLGDSIGIADSYINMGNANTSKEEYEKALDYFGKALIYYENLGMDDAYAVTLNNMGSIYHTQKKYGKALGYYEQALKINTTLNIPENIAYNLQNIGYAYLSDNQPDKAIESFFKSNQIGKEFKHILKDNYEYLANAYSEKGDYKNAYLYQKQFTTIKDSLFSEESEQRINELQTKYETAQKEQQIVVLTQSNEIQQLEITQKNIFIYTAVIISLLILGLALLFYNRYRLKNRANFLLAAANTEIRQSAAEKEVLLQEIHHRVKNNLQLISSILGWQAENIQDQTMLRLIEESKSRIKSMALIHETLYRSQNLAQVNVAAYLQDLLYYIEKSTANKTDVEVETRIDPIQLTAEVIIPIGLIVNELMTNAYKYAFEDKPEGRIILVFQKKEDLYYLKVEDNGKGLPLDYEQRMKKSLGLQLVQTLSKQLKGKLTIGTKDPTRFELTF